MKGAGAGLRYGGLAFLAGAVLGPVRELLLAPRIGGLLAALAEAAAMAVVLWWVAGRVTAGLASWRERAVAAGVGLLVVLLLETALGLAFAASGLAAARAPRGMAEEAVGLVLLAWLVLLPFLVRRHAVALP